MRQNVAVQAIWNWGACQIVAPFSRKYGKNFLEKTYGNQQKGAEELGIGKMHLDAIRKLSRD